MVNYLGKEWTPEALRSHIGHMDQVAGIRMLEHADGHARGSRVLHVYTGSGMSFDVLPDRALDIAQLQYNGMSLTWSSSTGEVHPAYYEPEKLGWLRSFHGGLIATCGLDHFGAPTSDDGQDFGIHGRIGNLPAEQVAYRTYWDGDDYRLEISGQVRQTRLFGENLVLRRVITTALGSNKLTVRDQVVNEGFAPQPHMILYHCNFGFPLLSDGSHLQVNTIETHPRDVIAEPGINTWMVFQQPTNGYQEQVFRHVVQPEADGDALVTLHNPEIKMGVNIRYSEKTLPHLFQWKQMGKGAYVLGIEPGNSSAVEGRAVARERNDLPHLEAGESCDYHLSFEVFHN